MAIAALGPAGISGIVIDIPPAELPPNVWTNGYNVQFRDGGVWSVKDSSVLLDNLPVIAITAFPGALSPVGFATWLIASSDKVHAYMAGELYDITRVAGSYTGGSIERWSGGTVGGVSVLNNGIDPPQAWLTPETTTKLIDLPNWPSGVLASCVRVYKQFVVALDITKAGVRYPTLVKWSHPADPGTVPPSWDETDPTKDAGEYPLSETSGHCVDCVPLRDANIIYKQDSVWLMQYIGGTFIFKFSKIFGDFGVQKRDCVVEYQSGRHFVFTGTDLIVHDGQTARSVVAQKVRSLIKDFSADQLRSCFVCLNASDQEVWFCFRHLDDGELPTTRAIAYNWTDDTISLRGLNGYRFATNGRIDPPVTGVITWEDESVPWDQEVGEWGDAVVIPSTLRIFGLRSGAIDLLEASSQSSTHCWVERTYVGVQMKAEKPPDLTAWKFITRVWPRVTGTVGDVLNFYFGSADNVGKPVDWEPALQFVIGVDEFLDLTLTAKTFSLRIESLNSAQWSYYGMDVEVIFAGHA